ncbi:hypothetical protein JXC34_07310 [Candidatus Woesearchaeota archaeon]|nr:hypothetical protein [Candidatus Woesearchaeota archaeon]
MPGDEKYTDAQTTADNPLDCSSDAMMLFTTRELYDFLNNIKMAYDDKGSKEGMIFNYMRVLKKYSDIILVLKIYDGKEKLTESASKDWIYEGISSYKVR